MSAHTYKGKLRVRSCGILIENDKILLLKLHSPVTNNHVWMPPGGGIELGESLNEALLREFAEETGLEITVIKLLHVHELIKKSFHTIEFYFLVERTGGELKLGTDPEHTDDAQILHSLRFFSEEEVRDIELSPEYIRDEFWREKEAGFNESPVRVSAFNQ